MNFEFDAAKSRSNLQKHGIDFEAAQEIWKGPYVNFLARAEFENRFAIIGPWNGKLYTCIYTIRGDRIRIISCRRSREGEVKLYEKSL
ncbi:BrnT family toxin [bacterium]|nr:MAG: BrnT family toxin [bacterium]